VPAMIMSIKDSTMSIMLKLKMNLLSVIMMSLFLKIITLHHLLQ